MTDAGTQDGLIDRILEAYRQHDQLLFDEEYEHRLGPPNAEARLLDVEGRLGTRLPGSFRKFLAKHDGWSRFTGDAVVLRCDDFGADWVRQRIATLSDLFFEAGPDPFERGCFPLVLGEDARSFLVADPTTMRPDGEMDLLFYDLVRHVRIFGDFNAFLEYKLSVLQQIIDSERHGDDD